MVLVRTQQSSAYFESSSTSVAAGFQRFAYKDLIMMSLFVELVNYNGPNDKLVLNFVSKMFDRIRIVLQKLNSVTFFVESFVLIVNCLITRLKAFNCSLIEQVV